MIIRKIKSPSHTFINIHVHELTRSAQCKNSFPQIDEIKDLFQVSGVIFTINGVYIPSFPRSAWEREEKADSPKNLFVTRKQRIASFLSVAPPPKKS